jgi:membrane-bound serine protease (ClpP class)
MDRWIRDSAGGPAQELELFCGDRLVAAALFLVAAAAFLYAVYGPRWAVAAGVGLAALACGLALCYAAGRVGGLGTVLVLTGLALLALEVCMPGFGVVGILGGLAVAAGWYTALDQPALYIGLMLAVALLIILGGRALRRRYGASRSLRWVTQGHTQRQEAGYVAREDIQGVAVGDCGVAQTALRPQGRVDIRGQRYEAVSRSGMLDAGTGVRVCAVTAARVEVEAMEEEGT